MGIRTVFLSFLIVFVSFGVGSETAFAKKFGGGGSFGKSFSIPTKKSTPAPTKAAPTQNKTADSKQAAGTQATQKRGGMGGMLGGLLAGGLLGALLFGGGFDGIQMMDIVIMLAVAFIAFKIFSMMRKQSQPQPAMPNGAVNRDQYQAPTSDPQYRENQSSNNQTSGFDFPKETAEPVTETFDASAAAFTLPEWFNEENFIGGARSHFMTLQQAWDQHAWDEIATYTSADLLAMLKEERKRHPEQQTTEVVSVLAEIVNFIDEGDHVVVSVNFYGWLKEDSDETTEFNEVWHLTRDMKEDGANWMIVGIQQPS